MVAAAILVFGLNIRFCLPYVAHRVVHRSFNIIKIRQSVLDLQPFVDFQYGGRRHLEFWF
jgi:hypothetical protein